MKGNFDAYVLWTLDKMVQNWIVDQSTARNFTVILKKKGNLKEEEAAWAVEGSSLLKYNL